MPYNTCNKRVLGQNKKWVSGAIFCQKLIEKWHFCSKMTENSPAHGHLRYLEAWEVHPRSIACQSTTSAQREFSVRTKSGLPVPFSVKNTQKKGIQHALFAPEHPTSTTGHQIFIFHPTMHQMLHTWQLGRALGPRSTPSPPHPVFGALCS